MDWKQIIRARIESNVNKLRISDAAKQQVLEDELARAVADTIAHRSLSVLSPELDVELDVDEQ